MGSDLLDHRGGGTYPLLAFIGVFVFSPVYLKKNNVGHRGCQVKHSGKARHVNFGQVR